MIAHIMFLLFCQEHNHQQNDIEISYLVKNYLEYKKKVKKLSVPQRWKSKW